MFVCEIAFFCRIKKYFHSVPVTVLLIGPDLSELTCTTNTGLLVIFFSSPR